MDYKLCYYQRCSDLVNCSTVPAGINIRFGICKFHYGSSYLIKYETVDYKESDVCIVSEGKSCSSTFLAVILFKKKECHVGKKVDCNFSTFKLQICNENGTVIETRKHYPFTKFWTWGAKMKMYDNNLKDPKLLYYIEEIKKIGYRKYKIEQDGVRVALIKEKQLFKPKLEITSEKFGDYTVEGKVLGHSFQILNDGLPIGSVSKKWLAWGDTYELDILDSFDYTFFTALVLAIDNCIHEE
eukprot:gene2470-3056_t